MSSAWLSVASEGETDAEIIRVVLARSGLPRPATVFTVSKPGIVQRIGGYNSSALHRPWYVQIDLDTDYQCAPEAASVWVPSPARWMVLGIARPEVEAWLLGDRDRCARWLGVSVANIPLEPDEVSDAKARLLDIVRRHGSALRKRQLLPSSTSGRSVGPEYEAELVRFATQRWRPSEAAQRSPSLRRTIERLRDLHARWTTEMGDP